MLNNYKSIVKKLDVITTFSIYTVPSNTTTILNLITCANINSNQDIVEISLRKSGDSSDTFINKGATIPVATTFRIDGPIVLNTGDILKVKAGTINTIDVTIHIMEIT